MVECLDKQKRYQLIDPLPEQLDPVNGVEVGVLDRQPSQSSLLEELHNRSTHALDELMVVSPEAIRSIEGVEQFKLPAIARTYLTLQSQCNSSLPQIHDAWQQDGRTVVLLEDRSGLLLLSDFLNNQNILPIQILCWFHEMTELWAVLQPYLCSQSLLELSNLRVDEDQILCLQRLYLNKPECPPTLKDLGHLWQLLCEKSHCAFSDSLMTLCNDLRIGNITTLEQLQAKLEVISDELQPNLVGATMTSINPNSPDDLIPFSKGGAMDEVSPSSQTDIVSQEPTPSADVSVSASPTQIQLGDPDDDITSEVDDAPTVVLPMKLVSIEEVGRSDVGRQREHNEDFFCIQTQTKKLETPAGRLLQAKGLYILCDGMGGHAGGEVASTLAVDTLRQYFEQHWQDQLPDDKGIREAIHQANKTIFDLNQQNDRSGIGRMGTTVVMVLIQDTEAAIAHVGDSRLYRFSRRHGLEQITIDHEVGQREIQRGVEPAIAYARPDAYQLTQALGPRDEHFVNPDVQFLELNEDMLLLLCSDGLTDNNLLEAHWTTHLEPLLNPQTNLEQGVNQLIEVANHYNGHDNITAIAVRARVRPNLEQIRQ
jgi:protein phosphatase